MSGAPSDGRLDISTLSIEQLSTIKKQLEQVGCNGMLLVPARAVVVR